MAGRNAALVAELRRLVEPGGLVEGPDAAGYEVGQRYGCGKALSVIRPASVDELRTLVRFCAREHVHVVVQGANTGLVGASTPDASGDQLLLNLDRLSGIDALDPLDRSATVLAGTRLSAVNEAARPHGLSFPIDLGADPSIGGMVATNTGGARLLRYGDVRKNLLGLEVILLDEDATLLSGLRGLRKDNSGVDWKQLFVGTGGSLGIVTRARLELRRLPSQALTLLLVPRDHGAVPELVAILEAALGDILSACEGMSRNAIEVALKHHPALRNPFRGETPDYSVLIEVETTLAPSHGFDLEFSLTDVLAPLFDGPAPLLADALVGRSAAFWSLRHAISDGLRREGAVIAFDIAMPRSRLPAFRRRALAAIGETFPWLLVCDFGHCGDGGDHFNIVWPHDAPLSFAAHVHLVHALRDMVYDLAVLGHDGTFSAEHGLGPHNAHYYRRYTSPEERALGDRLKQLLDPKRLLGNIDHR